MGLNEEIARASSIMWRYHMPKEVQVELVKMLVDAGVNYCLAEQDRIRLERQQVVDQIFGKPIQ